MALQTVFCIPPAIYDPLPDITLLLPAPIPEKQEPLLEEGENKQLNCPPPMVLCIE